MSKQISESGAGLEFRKLRVGTFGLFCFRTERQSIMLFSIEVSSHESSVLRGYGHSVY